ncbi:hypothetical protein SCHPADRAFT_938684 [Schizopora paradoxa]|uniref:Uncharacterized protein n=1 Tax=Schizopora paradoxa TaxID=27342 RepID=A0A0H2RTZ0_9AGAM|nr:hypothetical protein SCHPADRAFT_938684 [Schizopora paradoxa]
MSLLTSTTSTALLSPIISAYRLALQPIAPFTWVGSPVSAFDVVAAFRLCVALRQMREAGVVQHLQRQRVRRRVTESPQGGEASASEKRVGGGVSGVGGAGAGGEAEEYSLVKNVAVVLVTVYGGESVMCPWLGIPPSFLASPIVPGLYASLTALVDGLPESWVPPSTFKTELPLSFLDGLTRAFLLCQLIPPVVTAHAVPAVASNPWTLILSSLVIANGGFFFVNLLSMLQPTGFALATPAELRALGWTTTDLWCAPLTTALYALLTHAQPFWADLHALLLSFCVASSSSSSFASSVGAGGVGGTEKPPLVAAEALEPETARAACAVFLATLFVTRTVRNFGGAYMKELRGEKKKVMRSRIDGKRYPGASSKKTQ